MKLSLIIEDKLPSELKHLANDYWRIRDDSISGRRMIEPYICISISKKIKEYLEAKGHTIRFVKDKEEYHFYLEVDGRYVVDGSDYQFDYDKPIGHLLPPRISQVLDRNNITTIGSVTSLIDFSMNHTLDWTDAGCGWNPNLDPEDHKLALQELRTADLEVIKGRLLPIMLKIQPIEKCDRSYIERDPN